MHEGEFAQERYPEAGGQPETVEEHGSPPRIYVASLSDYNAGVLHGRWINAAQEPEEIQVEVEAMLRDSREPIAEEWAIHDFEGFGPVAISEWESFEKVSQLALGIETHGQAFAAFASIVDGDPERLEQFEEGYRGEWESVETYADEWLNEVGATEILDGVPDWLQAYVRLDTAGFARDLQLGGDIQVVEKPDGGVWIYEGNC